MELGIITLKTLAPTRMEALTMETLREQCSLNYITHTQLPRIKDGKKALNRGV